MNNINKNQITSYPSMNSIHISVNNQSNADLSFSWKDSDGQFQLFGKNDQRNVPKQPAPENSFSTKLVINNAVLGFNLTQTGINFADHLGNGPGYILAISGKLDPAWYSNLQYVKLHSLDPQTPNIRFIFGPFVNNILNINICTSKPSGIYPNMANYTTFSLKLTDQVCN